MIEEAFWAQASAYAAEGHTVRCWVLRIAWRPTATDRVRVIFVTSLP